MQGPRYRITLECASAGTLSSSSSNWKHEASVLASSNQTRRKKRAAIPLGERPGVETSGNCRFTRVLFGLAPSPFLLGGVVQQHLDSCRAEHPEVVAEIQRRLYVDDLITGGSTVQEAQQIKSSAVKFFNKARFQLHKWNANAPELETPEALTNGERVTFGKEQLGVPQEGEATLFGLAWDKERDTIRVKFPLDPAQPSKRGTHGCGGKVDFR